MKKIVFYLLLVLLCGCTPPNITSTPDDLAEQYVRVINTNNKEGLRELIHPKCYVTLTDVQTIFFEAALDQLLASTFPKDRTITIKTTETLPLSFGDCIWHVIPTHEMHINYTDCRHIQSIVQDKTQWFLLLPTFDSHELENFLKEYGSFY